MDKDSQEAKTVVERIKKLLLNYDLAIAYGKGEIDFRTAEMNKYEGVNGYGYKKFIVAKVEKARFEIYVAEMESAKKELLDNLEIITDKYIGKYKQVFYSYFIEGKTYQEIAEITNYSFEAIKVIIRRLKGELINMFSV